MTNNPEFDRNCWLELSLHRLILMPVILGLSFTLQIVLSNKPPGQNTAFLAMFFFVLFSGVWGTKRASNSVYQELLEHTWDWQRMSGLSPWSMTWGKLFGSTIYAWYGGILCVLVATVTLHLGQARPEQWQWLLFFTLLVCFSHLFSFLLSLLFIHRRPQQVIRNGGSLYLLVLILVFIFSFNISKVSNRGLDWYGMEISLLNFIIYSLALLCIWMLIGSYRVMRKEFQYQNTPWVWALFLLFLAFWLGGFNTDRTQLWLLSATVIWWVSTIVALLVEKKDLIEIRTLVTSIQQFNLEKTWLLTPAWLISFVFTSLAAISLVLVSDQAIVEKGRQLTPWILVSLFMLFLTRDTALFLMMSINKNVKQPESTAVVYLVMFYMIIPWLLNLFKLDSLTVVFLPRPDLNPMLALTGGVISAAVFIMLLIMQWQPSSYDQTDREKI